MTTNFTLTSWNFQRVGTKGELGFSDGRPTLTTAMAINTLERVCLGADVIQATGGIFGMQEGWCAHAAEELAGLIKNSHPYFAPSPHMKNGKGINGIGDAIRRRIHPLSMRLAEKITESSRGLVLLLGALNSWRGLAPHVEGLGQGLSNYVSPFSANTVRFIEDNVPKVVGYLGGSNVGYQPTLLEKTLQWVINEDLVARAAIAVLNPGPILGESVEVVSPYPITHHHFTPHPMQWGLELLANKGILETEIQIPGTDQSVPMTLLNVHLNDGRTRRAQDVRKQQIIALYQRAKQLIQEDKQVVIAGDFNIRAEDEQGHPTVEYQWLLSRIHAIGMVEAHQSCWGKNHRERPTHTFDPHIPILPERNKRKPTHDSAATPTHGRARYDFIFVGPGLRVKSIRVLLEESLVRTPGIMTYALSDHYPLHAQIEMTV